MFLGTSVILRQVARTTRLPPCATEAHVSADQSLCAVETKVTPGKPVTEPLVVNVVPDTQ